MNIPAIDNWTRSSVEFDDSDENYLGCFAEFADSEIEKYLNIIVRMVHMEGGVTFS